MSALSPAEALGSSQLFLQSAKTHQGELERERDALRDQVAAAERGLRQAEVRDEQQQGEVRRLRSAVEEAGLERAELVSKLQGQRAQCDQLERRCTQLQAQTMRGNPHSRGEGANEEKVATEVQKWKEEYVKVRISCVCVWLFCHLSPLLCVRPAAGQCAAEQPGQGGAGGAGQRPPTPAGAGEAEPPGRGEWALHISLSDVCVSSECCT